MMKSDVNSSSWFSIGSHYCTEMNNIYLNTKIISRADDQAEEPCGVCVCVYSFWERSYLFIFFLFEFRQAWNWTFKYGTKTKGFSWWRIVRKESSAGSSQRRNIFFFFLVSQTRENKNSETKNILIKWSAVHHFNFIILLPQYFFRFQGKKTIMDT